MSRILIVEDEPAILLGLSGQLRREGYEVTTAITGDDGLSSAQTNPPDLIVLDLMLPGLSGYEICRTLRSQGRQMPILMLTARGEETDRVLGLDIGADDYLTKPFSLRELLARIRALLRRTQSNDKLQIGDVEIDFAAYTATRAGRPIEISRRELLLLRALTAKPNRVLSRDELLDSVVGEDVYVSNRVIDNYIVTLRAKLPEGHLVTIRGAGYKWIP
ncbi:MAG: response regulator [Acidobacteria bacterium]|nr:response regulator [Acidobacteriota bacterium]